MFAVKLEGFKTKKQAEQFASWYSRQGEQGFYDELDCVGMSPEDGCITECNADNKMIDNTLVVQLRQYS